MGIRLRTLRIGSRAFTWHATIHHVAGSGDCHRCLRVRVWGAGKNGRALQADLLSGTWPSRWGSCCTDTAFPASGAVKILIRYALGHGWDPELRGGTFLLSEADHDAEFTLPGYLLTDRLGSAAGGDPTARVIRAYELRQAA